MGAKGIAIRNDTGKRVFIGISLGAYMYWDAVEPDQWFIRNTGKVWMTVSARVLSDKSGHEDMPTTAGQVATMFAAPVLILNSLSTGSGNTSSCEGVYNEWKGVYHDGTNYKLCLKQHKELDLVELPEQIKNAETEAN